SRRRHTRSKRDWSSDVCSSDLLHKPPKGLRIQQPQLGLAPRPLKAAVTQPLVQQKISVSRPVERLDPICPATAKQEQAFLIQLCAKLLRDNSRQSVDPAAQIGVPAGDIVPAHLTEIHHTV